MFRITKSRFGLTSFHRLYSTDRIEQYLRAHGNIRSNQTYGDFLLGQKLIAEGETPNDMFDRVANTLASAGDSFYNSTQRQVNAGKFKKLLSEFKIILSTPIYTNAGRHQLKPLSACAVPPVNFRESKPIDLQQIIKGFHTKGMGTGFNLDDAVDPVAVLRFLNSCAVEEVKQGLIERPVGNMAILSLDHPRVMEFVRVKEQKNVLDWKFNISINLPAKFFRALNEKELYVTKHGAKIVPHDFLRQIASSALKTGDPGVIFMHKHEMNNKVPHLGSYVTVSPCAEVPLLSGEICHFGYINLYAFVHEETIDYDTLRDAIHQTVLMLDNAIQLSLNNMGQDDQTSVVARIRRIGVGVCGFADALMAFGLPYNSPQAFKLAANIMSFINYESKKASIELAKLRGSFPEFSVDKTRKDLILGDYQHIPTDTVSLQDWEHLNRAIQRYGIRNISTVILPPTGRSALLGGVSASIEPQFKLTLDPQLITNLTRVCQRQGHKVDLEQVFAQIKRTGSIAGADLPSPIKAIFLNCLELSPETHIEMAAQFQRFTDEAISKTVNLPSTASSDDVANIYSKAYAAGLKGMTVYVDKSRTQQPLGLGSNELNLKTKFKL